MILANVSSIISINVKILSKTSLLNFNTQSKNDAENRVRQDRNLVGVHNCKMECKPSNFSADVQPVCEVMRGH